MVKTLALGTLVFGLALGAYLLLVGRDGSRDGPTGPAPLPNDARLAAAVEDLTRRMDVLEHAPALANEAPRVTAELLPSEDRLLLLERRVADLEEQLAEIRKDEALDTSSMSAEDLVAAYKAAYGRRDYKVAARLCRALLEREIDFDTKSEAMSMLGYACRFLGERDEELRTFRALVDMHGENTERGLNAVFAVGWTLASQENYEEGRREMEKVVSNPESSASIRKWARYWAANYAVRLNDHGRARQLVTGLIEEYKDSPDQNDRLAAQYAERLKAELE